MLFYHQVARKKADLKKKLRVQFHNEPGLDMGGLTKEWFLLLLRKIFKEEYGQSTNNLLCTAIGGVRFLQWIKINRRYPGQISMPSLKLVPRIS